MKPYLQLAALGVAAYLLLAHLPCAVPDKYAHVLGSFCLAFVVEKKRLFAALLLLELLQPAVGRHFELSDLLANLLGIAANAAVLKTLS